MSTKAESVTSLNPVYAELAEITVADRAFRSADSEPYDGLVLNPDITVEHAAAREAAKEIIFDTLVAYRRSEPAEKRWEMSRMAALKEIGGTALGSFSRYFIQLEAEAPESLSMAYELPKGEAKVIDTNNSIVTANRLYEDPLEFLDVSLGMIDRRKHQSRFAIGPENYATTLKFFTDKYSELDHPSEDVNVREITPLVSESLKGFFEVSRRDEPNFVEMTNLYASIRTLPKGSVEQQFTRGLLTQSLRSLPEYGNATIATLLGALPKLDLSEDGETAASLVNLALRKSKKFETTNDFRVALRALEVIPESTASEQAVRAFLSYHNNLEQSLDLEGADETAHRLRRITDHVISSPELHVQIKALSERTARKASELCKRAFLDGGLTSEQETQIKQTFARVMANYKAI